MEAGGSNPLTPTRFPSVAKCICAQVLFSAVAGVTIHGDMNSPVRRVIARRNDEAISLLGPAQRRGKIASPLSRGPSKPLLAMTDHAALVVSLCITPFTVSVTLATACGRALPVPLGEVELLY